MEQSVALLCLVADMHVEEVSCVGIGAVCDSLIVKRQCVKSLPEVHE